MIQQFLSRFDTASEASLILYIAIFVGVMLAFEGIRQLVDRGETAAETRNRRMRMLARGDSAEEVFRVLSSQSGRTTSPIGRLRNMLSKAGLPNIARRLIAIMVITGALLSLFLSQLLAPAIAAFLSFLASVAVPFIVLAAMAETRSKKLVSQLPDSLDLMARGLRVGHPLSTTVASVATDMPDPIGTEFGLIQDQVNFGDDIATAFRDFADRTDIEDTRFLAVSVGIQHGTGGNLARILTVLSKVIRDRATMRKKIRAISSEGRLSAFILTMLPALIFGMVYATSPTFYSEVADDPLFLPLIGVIAVLVVLQALILRRLVNIKY